MANQIVNITKKFHNILQLQAWSNNLFQNVWNTFTLDGTI